MKSLSALALRRNLSPTNAAIHLVGVFAMTPKNDLRDRLARASEINLTVTGRKSGRQISYPVLCVVVEKEQT